MKIAITGIIGSGKSTVSKLIAEKYPVLDTDLVTHDLLEDEAINREVARKVLKINDQRIVTRQEIAQVVFRNSHKLEQLEDIIHPLVKAEIDRWSDRQAAEHVFVEVPLLYESGFESLFDFVIVVSASETVALERLMTYRGYTKDEALKRIDAQMSIEDKVERADYVIDNSNDILELENKVSELLATLEEVDNGITRKK